MSGGPPGKVRHYWALQSTGRNEFLPGLEGVQSKLRSRNRHTVYYLHKFNWVEVFNPKILCLHETISANA